MRDDAILLLLERTDAVLALETQGALQATRQVGLLTHDLDELDRWLMSSDQTLLLCGRPSWLAAAQEALSPSNADRIMATIEQDWTQLPLAQLPPLLRRELADREEYLIERDVLVAEVQENRELRFPEAQSEIHNPS